LLQIISGSMLQEAGEKERKWYLSPGMSLTHFLEKK